MSRIVRNGAAAFCAVLLLFAAPLRADEVDFLDDEAYEAGEEEIASIYDPLEPFNRVMFTINDCLYLWVLDPVATGYSYVVPKDFRTIISNFKKKKKQQEQRQQRKKKKTEKIQT